MHVKELELLVDRIALLQDEAAFKQLYFHYTSPLFKLANSFLNAPEIAEEIVDDVFVKIWERRASLKEINNLTVYLYVAVKNASLNHLASKLKISVSNIDNLTFEIKDSAPSAEQNLISAELMHLVNVVIEQMNPQCKLVFKLVKEDGLKYKEVAEILNISTKTVEYHIGNALKKIASLLKPTKKVQL